VKAEPWIPLTGLVLLSRAIRMEGSWKWSATVLGGAPQSPLHTYN